MRRIRYLLSPVREFIDDSRAVGIVLLFCTAISLFLSNSGWAATYLSFWERTVVEPYAVLHLPHSFVHWINDGLMSVFFFMAGLEIKRELLTGELSSLRKAMLPVIAAVGGMLAPAAIYALWAGQTDFASGWGIPMATDIAFSLGIVSLLGARVPLSFRVFLTALAIIDDLGGILAIAIFYASDLNTNYMLYAFGVLTLLIVLNLLHVRLHYIYLILGILLWYMVFNSGVHATIAGVLTAFTIPKRRIDALIHELHDPVSFLILPLFALANTAIAFPNDFSAVIESPVFYGIASGLVLGKPLGIVLSSWLAVRLGVTTMPARMTFPQLLGIGFIAGIGFTMSIFISMLAFDDIKITVVAKVAVMVASFIAGLAGYFLLMATTKRRQRKVTVGAGQPIYN